MKGDGSIMQSFGPGLAAGLWHGDMWALCQPPQQALLMDQNQINATAQVAQMPSICCLAGSQSTHVGVKAIARKLQLTVIALGLHLCV